MRGGCVLGLCSSYYANWSGLGVEYKTTDETPRVIFWSRYLDWVVTGPVRSLFVCACGRRGCGACDACGPCAAENCAVRYGAAVCQQWRLEHGILYRPHRFGPPRGHQCQRLI